MWITGTITPAKATTAVTTEEPAHRTSALCRRCRPIWSTGVLDSWPFVWRVCRREMVGMVGLTPYQFFYISYPSCHFFRLFFGDLLLAPSVGNWPRRYIHLAVLYWRGARCRRCRPLGDDGDNDPFLVCLLCSKFFFKMTQSGIIGSADRVENFSEVCEDRHHDTVPTGENVEKKKVRSVLVG